MENYFDVYYEGNIIVEQEETIALAVFKAEEYLTQKCVDGVFEFDWFDLVLKEYNEAGDATGFVFNETIFIEDQPTDLEEHSIYNAHDLGVRCGKIF